MAIKIAAAAIGCCRSDQQGLSRKMLREKTFGFMACPAGLTGTLFYVYIDSIAGDSPLCGRLLWRYGRLVSLYVFGYKLLSCVRGGNCL